MGETGAQAKINQSGALSFLSWQNFIRVCQGLGHIVTLDKAAIKTAKSFKKKKKIKI